jgi:hypothetical protein
LRRGWESGELVFSGLSFAEVVVRGMPKIRPLSEQTLMNDYVFSMVVSVGLIQPIAVGLNQPIRANLK